MNWSRRPPTASPTRERYVAGFVDHLPDGAAMSVKQLAKQLPLYGQQAVSTALKALSVAGHLRRVRCSVGAGDESRWVSWTFWSRTVRDNEWWNTYLAAVPQQRTAPEPTPDPAPAPATTPTPPPAAFSPAYLALAQLGRSNHRLGLSADDCTTLEPFAAQWLDRGVTTDYLTSTLKAGLPAQIDSPAGLIRRRLIDKLPPQLPANPNTPANTPTPTPARRLLVECTDCGRPGPPEALPDGLCRPCHTTHSAGGPPSPDATQIAAVKTHMANLRDLLKPV
ncbi:MarR family transcriptional regulator [Streptomyces rubiginosohelvolus]|uniref:MarR family transcriptional regulator n=1 Tax=Streptomyces rubiginosohelvolus TaxID=67362 RepID=UPI0033BBD9B4